jgi:hypothetical protein
MATEQTRRAGQQTRHELLLVSAIG